MLISSEKVIVIKSFLTGVLYDCFRNICAYLNKSDKICKCYNCLKMVIQVPIYMLVFSQYFSLNMHHLVDSIYI